VCLLVVYTFYIKMDLQNVEWRGIDWIGLAQDRVRWRVYVKAVMKYINFFRPGHSYVSLNLVTVPNKCTISNCYKHWLSSSFMFRYPCTIFREKIYASFFKTKFHVKLLPMGSFSYIRFTVNIDMMLKGTSVQIYPVIKSV
jgi:hypothetical protein